MLGRKIFFVAMVSLVVLSSANAQGFKTYFISDAGVYIDLPAEWEVPNNYGNIEGLPVDVAPTEDEAAIMLFLLPSTGETTSASENVDDRFLLANEKITEYFAEKGFKPELQVELDGPITINEMKAVNGGGPLKIDEEKMKVESLGAFVFYDAPEKAVFVFGVYGTMEGFDSIIGEGLEDIIMSVRLTATAD